MRDPDVQKYIDKTVDAFAKLQKAIDEVADVVKRLEPELKVAAKNDKLRSQHVAKVQAALPDAKAGLKGMAEALKALKSERS